VAHKTTSLNTSLPTAKLKSEIFTSLTEGLKLLENTKVSQKLR